MTSVSYKLYALSNQNYIYITVLLLFNYLAKYNGIYIMVYMKVYLYDIILFYIYIYIALIGWSEGQWFFFSRLYQSQYIYKSILLLKSWNFVNITRP